VIYKRVVAILVLQPPPPSLALTLPLSILSGNLGYQLDLALSMSVLHSSVYFIGILIRYSDECKIFLAFIFQDLI
jgi:hypothetical protein